MNNQTLFNLIALKLTTGVGEILGRNLISYSGGVNAIFEQNRRSLIKIPGVGSKLAGNIINKESFTAAEKEINFILKNNIEVISYYKEAYPTKMKPHNTMPFLFFTKGKPNLQPSKTLGIVGTRKCTEYGKTITKKIVKELADISDLTIVSGLAFGIDKTAHQAAVDNNLSTIGVLGHGLQTVYPSQNKKLANQMIEHNGSGLLSQFCSTQTLLPANFPKRNEVIAGLSDAILVVETDLKGGSTITVEIAFGMNKDILAIPGKVGDKTSRGCNSLIKYNKAALVENANDIKRLMGWTTDENTLAPQKQLFIELTETETTLINCLKTEKEWHVDSLTAQSKFTPSSLSATLLSLEMKGVVQSLPGKIYRLI